MIDPWRQLLSISDDNELGVITQKLNAHFNQLKNEHGDAYEAARRMDPVIDAMKQNHPKHRRTLEKIKSEYRVMGRRV